MKTIIILLILSSFITGCGDNLDKDPPSKNVKIKDSKHKQNLKTTKKLQKPPKIVKQKVKIPKVVTTIPKPRNRYWWWTSRVKEISGYINQMDECNIIFIGDSITHYWKNEGNLFWKHFLSKYKPLNFGLGGDRTQHILYRLQKENFGKLHPKIAVILAGTNNLAVHNSPQITAFGVKAIIDETKIKFPGIKIMLFAIFPMGLNPNKVRTSADRTNKILETYGNGKDIFYYDMNEKFLDHDHKLKENLFRKDHLHLNAKGYSVWGNFIVEKLKSKPLETVF